MTDLQAFLAMGGYAAYVWPAYAIVLLVLIANAVVPHRRERALYRRIAAQADRERR